MNPPPVEHELFLADYIGMFIVVAPFAVIFFSFAFYVAEIVYLRNYKKPLIVFANINFLKRLYWFINFLLDKIKSK
mgnify:CR=1 FL=1